MRHPLTKPLITDTLLPEQQYTAAATIGNRCYIRARERDGRAVFVEHKYSPTYYLPTNLYTGITSHDGRPLAPVNCRDIYAGKDFLQEHPHAYGNIQCEYQYLSDVYGAQEIAVDMDRLYIVNIDIEVAAATAYAPVDDPFNEVTAITMRWRHRGQRGIVMYGTGAFTHGDGVAYVRVENEEALLTAFLADWRGKGDYPDIVTGWNIQFYDMPYLVNRLRRLFGDNAANSISPFERIEDRRVTLQGRDQSVVDIRGVAILDYLELYRKFTYTQQESYRLDHIAHIELKERKVSYAEYQSLQHLYQENFQKFMEYNRHDVELVDRLDEKLRFIELVCTLAYSAKANYVDTFRQVRLWDIMIYHHLRAKNQHIPPKLNVDKTEQYAGAYVKDPQVGQHKWVCSFDVASMYPHIIREWNLSPEMVVGDRWADLSVDTLLHRGVDVSARLGDEDLSVTANGVRTRRDAEGFLPEMIRSLYDERVKYKSLAGKAKKLLATLTPEDPTYAQTEKDIAAYNARQMALKISLNSLYGAQGSQYFRFYNTDMAEAVTLTGQLVIQWVANDVNAFLNRFFKTTDEDYVIASDTDSIYVRLERIVLLHQSKRPQTTTDVYTTLVDTFAKDRIAPLIESSLTTLADYLNVANPCLSMAREVIADKGIWTAKKRYILNCLDTEGVRHKTPKLKVMGLEMVKSSTPALCRKMLNDALVILMNKEQSDMWQFIEEQRKVFGEGKFEDVAFPRSVNGLEKYSSADKGIPIAVRGALVYNNHITSLPAYEQIKDGAKIKFAYLREPNTFRSNILSAPGGCPPEWNIESIIDFETQWAKSFIEPLKPILNCVGWTVEQEYTLF